MPTTMQGSEAFLIIGLNLERSPTLGQEDISKPSELALPTTNDRNQKKHLMYARKNAQFNKYSNPFAFDRYHFWLLSDRSLWGRWWDKTWRNLFAAGFRFLFLSLDQDFLCRSNPLLLGGVLQDKV